MKFKEQQPRPEEPEERDDVVVAVNRCPFCHDSVSADEEDVRACKGCLARHHGACWDEGGACGSCGGSEALVEAKSEAVSETPPPVELLRNKRFVNIFAAFCLLFSLLVLFGGNYLDQQAEAARQAEQQELLAELQQTVEELNEDVRHLKGLQALRKLAKDPTDARALELLAEFKTESAERVAEKGPQALEANELPQAERSFDSLAPPAQLTYVQTLLGLSDAEWCARLGVEEAALIAWRDPSGSPPDWLQKNVRLIFRDWYTTLRTQGK